jgi:hypothetical protein
MAQRAKVKFPLPRNIFLTRGISSPLKTIVEKYAPIQKLVKAADRVLAASLSLRTIMVAACQAPFLRHLSFIFPLKLVHPVQKTIYFSKHCSGL